MRIVRGLLLAPILKLLNWLLKHDGNSVIIGGPLGWTWEDTIDDAHHGSRGSGLHADSHARQHDHSLADDGSPIAVGGVPDLPASKVSSGTFALNRIPTPLTGKDADTVDGFGGPDATNPVTQAFGDSPSPGIATVMPKRDHRHGMPADPVPAHAALATGIHGVGASYVALAPAASHLVRAFTKGWTSDKLVKGAGVDANPTEVSIGTTPGTIAAGDHTHTLVQDALNSAYFSSGTSYTTEGTNCAGMTANAENSLASVSIAVAASARLVVVNFIVHNYPSTAFYNRIYVNGVLKASTNEWRAVSGSGYYGKSSACQYNGLDTGALTVSGRLYNAATYTRLYSNELVAVSVKP